MDLEKFGFCHEFYVVEKLGEVVVTVQGEPQQIRIEALLSPQTGHYQTRAYLAPSAQAQDAPGDGLIHRNERSGMPYRKLGRTNFMCSRLVFGDGAALIGGISASTQ